MNGDKTAIIHAAAKAEQAFTYLFSLQPASPETVPERPAERPANLKLAAKADDAA